MKQQRNAYKNGNIQSFYLEQQMKAIDRYQE